MTKTFYATYDGNVLRPCEPLKLKPDSKVTVTIEYRKTGGKKQRSFLQTAQSLNLRGPSDWSVRLEDYLYGKRKNAR